MSTMTITPEQRKRIDDEVDAFADRAHCGFVDVQVGISESYGTPGNVMLNLHHPGNGPRDYSLLTTQLDPTGNPPVGCGMSYCDCEVE